MYFRLNTSNILFNLKMPVGSVSPPLTTDCALHIKEMHCTKTTSAFLLNYFGWMKGI